MTALGCALNAQSMWRSLTVEKLLVAVFVDSSGLQKCLVTQSNHSYAAMMNDIHELRSDYDEGVFRHTLDKWKRKPIRPFDKTLSDETSSIMDSLFRDGRIPMDIDDSRTIEKNKQEEK